MGNLFAAILVAAPIAAFAIWAYLAQTERIWNETDVRQIELKIERSEFDLDFYIERGNSEEQIARLKKRLEELNQELALAKDNKSIHTQRGQAAIEVVEDKLQQYDEKTPNPLEKFNK